MFEAGEGGLKLKDKIAIVTGAGQGIGRSIAREKGYKVERVTYFVLASNERTPRPIPDTLVKLFTQTSNDPSVQASLVRGGFVPRPTNPEESEKYIIGDYEMAHDVLKNWV